MRATMLVGLTLAAALAGCSCEPREADTLSEKELGKVPAVNPTQLRELLDAQKGKVTALVVWSVRREACVAMYPKLAELGKGGAEPVVIAVNIDRVDDVRKKVLPLLKEHQPAFENRVVEGGPDALASFVSDDWMGAVPAIALYDREGKRVAAFFGDDALAKAQERLATMLRKR